VRILVINPGSTSTKLALFENEQPLVSSETQHPKEELARFERVIDQYPFRLDAIRTFLRDADIDPCSIVAVAGRGGLLHPLEGGVYAVSDEMVDDLKQARYGEHPCNLGAVLARELAEEWAIPAFIVDPVVTDEMTDVARLTGLPQISRRSLFHALNQRGVARSVSARLGIDYAQGNFIICHMGGGVSIGAHRQGRVVDVINALDGEGPFTSERTGGLPVLPVLDMVERGEKTPAELRQIILRQGGLYAHLGTNDPREVVARIEAGDDKARLVFAGLAYAIARSIASLVPAFADESGATGLTAVILTGGMARSAELVAELKRLVGSLGPVEVVVGEEEMGALAAGAARVLAGQDRAKVYHRLADTL